MRQKVFKSVILVLMLCLSFSTAALAKEPTPNTITVQGTSTVEIMPDQATISLSIVTNSSAAEAARNENALTAQKVKLSLTALGIEEDNIKTINYTMHPVYKYDDRGANPQITGYEIVHTLSVCVKDLAQTGNVIDNALAAGANRVEEIRFQKKDQLSLETRVLALATKEAQMKAEAIASALGKQITNVQSVNVGNLRVQEPQQNRELLLKTAGMYMDTPVFAGTMTIQGTVTAVFEIQ